jgi:hypothetical protein
LVTVVALLVEIKEAVSAEGELLEAELVASITIDEVAVITLFAEGDDRIPADDKVVEDDEAPAERHRRGCDACLQEPTNREVLHGSALFI